MSRNEPPPDDGTARYDPQTESYHIHHDWTKRPSVGSTIIDALSTLDGADVSEYPPLYDVIDVDALNTLFRMQPEDGSIGQAYLYFEYSGRAITVDNTGKIVIEAHEPPKHYRND
jgi:hypothetical protein